MKSTKDEYINKYTIDQILENELDSLLLPDKENIYYKEYDIPIYKSKINNFNKEILILSGGGVKGIAHIGALYGLEELGYLNKFKIIAGSSVGALIGGLFVCGYKPSEMLKFIKNFDLDSLKNLNILDVLKNYGLDNGLRLSHVIKKLIEAKGYNEKITLKELYNKTKKKLIITTVCVNNKNICYMSHESYPDLPLYLAIRMSTSIPLFYAPVKYNNNYYIDGGCIDNYPIHLFNDKINKVLGLYLIEDSSDIHYDNYNNIENLEDYLMIVFECIMKGLRANSTRGFDKFTINIKINESFTNFNISDKKKDKIFNIGYKTVMEKYK